MSVDQNERDKNMIYLKVGKEPQFFRETSYNYENGEVTVTPAIAQGSISGVTPASQALSVAFNTITDADAYLIEYNKTSTPDDKLSVIATSSPKSLTGLTGATEYKVRIKGLSGLNEGVYNYQGEFSDDSTATTGA